MRFWTANSTFLGLAFLLWIAPTFAKADSQVVVLGVESADGDDDFTSDLNGLLRREAGRTPGWALSDNNVSLSQMVLATGCSDADAACVGRIATRLHADVVIYGQVRRSGPGAQFTFELELLAYLAASQQIGTRITDSIPTSQRDVDQLRPRVNQYIGQIATELRPPSAGPVVGTLLVLANVPNASVTIAGTNVGVTHGDGTLLVENVEAGTHQVEIAAQGFGTFSGSVHVNQQQQTQLEVTLAPATPLPPAPPPAPEASPDLRWLGWTLTGVGAAMAGATVYSWVRLSAIDNDKSLRDWRESVPEGHDACTEAKAVDPRTAQASHVVSLCNEADTLEVLQYVFLGSALAAGSAGAIVLLTDDHDGAAPSSDPNHDNARLILEPHIGLSSASVTATLNF